MDTLRIRLFGKLSAHRGGDDLLASLPPKAQELLAYLLLYRERWHTRERLAAELWPEAGPREGRTRLRRLMWRLQDGLGEDPAATRLLKVQADWLGINADAGLWLDVEIVEQAYRRLGSAPDGVTPELAARLESASASIQGDLLDNWYQEWCIVERERLRIIQIGVLSRLTNYYVAHRQIERGVATASQLLQIDRAHEGAHRQLMRLRYMAGDRTGALRQFDICRNVLNEEFRVAPERLTLALYDELRNDQPASCNAQFPSLAERPQVTDDRASVESIHTRLDRLHRQVAASQESVTRSLHELQQALHLSSTDDHHRGGKLH
jgi:DNA-binding SARP family transcriptional activator